MIVNEECGERIIIVENKPKSLKKLAEILQQAAGCRVLTASGGRAAFALAARELPNLIISGDLDAEMSGTELCRLLRAEKSLKSIPLILITASKEEQKDGSNPAAEADEYFGIDYAPLRLVSKVARLLERRQAEVELSRSELRFKNIFQSDMMGTILWEKQGRILDANNAFLELLGYTKDDLHSGRINWIEITPEASRQADAEALAEIARHGVCQPYEKQYIKKNGEQIPVLIGGALLEGETETGVSFVLDIGGRKLAETKLLEAQNFNRKTINSLPGIFYLVDERGNLLRWNKSFAAITGYEAIELEKMHALDFFAESDWEIIAQTIERVFDEGEASVEAQIVAKDGTKTFHFFTGKRVVFENQNCLVGMGIDTGERKKIERNLQKSSDRLKENRRKLRALNARLQSVREEERIAVAREVHDSLGQALTAIRLDAARINKKIPAIAAAALRADLSEGIGNLLLLVDEAVTTVQNISAQLRPSLLDSVGLAAAIEWEARQFERRTEITCFCDVPETTMEIEAEISTAIFRIFQELLTNVSRHAEATRIWISLKKNGNMIIFTVRDNGQGIKKHRIAAPDALGLLGISERAHLWKGSVSIKGEPETGTEITVRIPAGKAADLKKRKVFEAI